MTNDPIVQVEEAEEALERFDEVTGCLQYGEGWSCTQPATPDGPPQLFGHDDRRNEVWMRRFRCVAGHWYHVETPAPVIEEAAGRDANATLRVAAIAS
ncbi:MAG TPA: hypothetical protein VIE12_04780 [Actinomycetota bacterium]